MTKILYFPNKFQRKNKKKENYSSDFFKKILRPSSKSKRILELRELYYYLEDLDVEYRYELLEAIVHIILKHNLKMPYNSPF